MARHEGMNQSPIKAPLKVMKELCIEGKPQWDASG